MGLGSLLKGVTGIFGDLAEDSVGSIAGSLIGGAGEVIGAVGRGKGSAAVPISGYGSLPAEIRDYLMKDIYPKIKDYGASPYKGIPRRRVNEADLDPVFGSKGLQDLQRYKDILASAAPDTPSTPAQTPSDSTIDSLKARLLIQQAAGPGGMYATRNNYPYLAILQNGTDADYAEIAKSLGPNASLAPNGQFYDSKTGKPIDTGGLSQIFRKYM